MKIIIPYMGLPSAGSSIESNTSILWASWPGPSPALILRLRLWYLLLLRLYLHPLRAVIRPDADLPGPQVQLTESTHREQLPSHQPRLGRSQPAITIGRIIASGEDVEVERAVAGGGGACGARVVIAGGAGFSVAVHHRREWRRRGMTPRGVIRRHELRFPIIVAIHAQIEIKHLRFLAQAQKISLCFFFFFFSWVVCTN